MTFNPDWFGRPAIESQTLHEAERAYLDECLDRVHAHLCTATVDADGKRLKEKDVRTAMKVVARL